MMPDSGINGTHNTLNRTPSVRLRKSALIHRRSWNRAVTVTPRLTTRETHLQKQMTANRDVIDDVTAT